MMMSVDDARILESGWRVVVVAVEEMLVAETRKLSPRHIWALALIHALCSRPPSSMAAMYSLALEMSAIERRKLGPGAGEDMPIARTRSQ